MTAAPELRPSLADFLEARFAEDESEARLLLGLRDARWNTARSSAVVVDFAVTDPARVLADIAAHRAIVELHGNPDHACPMWTPRNPGLLTHVGGPGPCSVIRLLAQPYAAHHDFDESWRLAASQDDPADS